MQRESLFTAIWSYMCNAFELFHAFVV